MGETQSKERTVPGDIGADAPRCDSFLVVNDPLFRTGTLDLFDRLCAEGDPIAILCDFAKTYNIQDDFDDIDIGLDSDYSDAMPGVKSKYLRLAQKNPDLARRVMLCHSTDTQRTDAVLKHIDHEYEVTHFFGFLCLKAYLVPHDLWSAVIRLAPEVARLEDRHGAISLFDAVGMGRASLNKIQAIVDADDQKKDEGSNSILEHVYYGRLERAAWRRRLPSAGLEKDERPPFVCCVDNARCMV